MGDRPGNGPHETGQAERVRFHPDAAQEYLDALSTIDAAREGFGRRFELSFQKKLRQATLFPSSGVRVDGFQVDVRRFGIKRFPYAIIVATTNDTPHVVAVAHQKRQPYWHYRLA